MMTLVSHARPTIVVVVEDGRHVCYWTTDGIDRRPADVEAHATPREAIDHARVLELMNDLDREEER